LLFGLTALVPLILHLYQRRRRTVVLFSTNQFFTRSIIRSQRRLRLRRFLLLLLRMGACILLAAALARPILNLAGLGARNGSRDVIVLLDDSLSMQAHDPRAGQTHFEQARRLAADALNSLASGDRAAVVTFTGRTLARSGRAGAELTPDVLGLVKEVEKLEPIPAAGDVRAALTQAAELFRGAQQRNRSVLVLTDLQRSDFPAGPWPQPDHAVGVTIVALDPPTRNNVAADQMILSQGTAIVAQPNLLRVRLTNYATEMAQAQLVLEVDGHETLRRPVELPGASPTIERIPVTFDKDGEHRLRLRVEHADELPADNVMFATVRVNPRLPVLIVDGDGPGRQDKPAAFYLRAAMQAVDADADSVEAETVKPEDLGGTPLEKYRVAVLSDVRALPLTQVERLEQFVQGGGGLAVFLGERVEAAFYNDALGAVSRPLGGLMPAELRSRLGAGDGGQAMHILEAQLDHPVLQRFKGTLRSALAGVSVYQAWAVAPRQAWVVATMEQGAPLIVERSYGRGRVMLFSAAPQPRWTNLPLRRAFIPLINHMVSYLAGGAAAETDHAVGQELALLRGAWDTGRPVQVLKPDGGRVQAAVKALAGEAVAYLPSAAVTSAGFYQVPNPPYVTMAGGQHPREWLAVNVPAAESDPRVLDTKNLQTDAGRWQVQTIDWTHHPAGQPIAALVGEGPASRGIWDTLLWVVLVLVLIEPWVANRIGAKKEAQMGESDE